MRISIVTISFNQARFIEQAMASVLTQDYPDIEYIVVDAGSTDGSREIIERYRERLASAIFEPDDGPAAGLNKGFAKATGDIFFYLNADDILLPGALKAAANHFANAPHADVVYGNGLQIDAQGRIVRRIFSSKWGLRAYAYGAVSVVQQATFIRCTAFNKAGGFNVANRTCWDGELLVDLGMIGCQLTQVNEFFGAFRVYPDSITGSGRLNQQTLDDLTRMTHRILGRPSNRLDYPLRFYYRVFKNIQQPVVLVKKLLDWFLVIPFGSLGYVALHEVGNNENGEQ